MTVVYFVQAGEGGFVKIGSTGSLVTRLPELQCGCPFLLTVLREVPGSRRAETWYHQRFAHLRHRGEWFSFHPDMMTVTPTRAELRGCPSDGSFLDEVETFLESTGMTATIFGRRALHDPCFVPDLRRGRSPSLNVAAKVRAFMESAGS